MNCWLIAVTKGFMQSTSSTICASECIRLAVHLPHWIYFLSLTSDAQNVKWSQFIKLSIALFFANFFFFANPSNDRVFYSPFFFFCLIRTFDRISQFRARFEIIWMTIGEEAYFEFRIFFYWNQIKSVWLTLYVLSYWLHFRKTIQLVNFFFAHFNNNI